MIKIKSKLICVIVLIPCLFIISTFAFFPEVYAQDKKQKEEIAEDYKKEGLLLQQQGNLTGAFSNYVKAISLGLKDAVLFNDVGILVEQLGRPGEAKQYYTRAIQLDKTYLPPYMNLAYLHQTEGNLNAAAQYFRLRYELGDPGDPWADKAKDELLLIKPEYKDWIVAMEAERLKQELIQKAHDDFYAQVEQANKYYLTGQKHYEDGRYKDALLEFNRALSLSPDNPKIVNAKKKAILELTKKNIEEYSARAVNMLNTGDTLSAQHEIQKILTTIPKEPILISQ